MVFSSALFLFLFIPLFFGAYYLFPNSMRNAVLLIGSIFFYSWGGAEFVLILLFSLLVDWHLSNAVYANLPVNKRISKFYLILSLILNIGMLVYFKYANFFVDNVNSLFYILGFESIAWTAVVMPIGISFIVFHKISYMVDVYRSSEPPTQKVSDYFVYILLFPMSIAGPIIKYNDISGQIRNRGVVYNDFLEGMKRFSIGLLKKVWIADTLATMADNLFNLPTESIGFNYAWLGIICYYFQIYFDFSGYADMAIGLSRMMGFRIAENFNKPYISQSISEFWKRWHISLTNWFKNYLYIPLGGNRCSKTRNYMNLWIVFLISGLWHGAGWNFIVWGALHGAFLVGDKLFGDKLSKKTPKPISIAATQLIILFAWVFFRADNLAYALGYIKSMFTFTQTGIDHILLVTPFYFDTFHCFTLGAAIVITFAPASVYLQQIMVKWQVFFEREAVTIMVTPILLIISMLLLVSSNSSPFIYFRF